MTSYSLAAAHVASRIGDTLATASASDASEAIAAFVDRRQSWPAALRQGRREGGFGRSDLDLELSEQLVPHAGDGRFSALQRGRAG